MMEEKLLLILLGAGLGFLIKSYQDRTQQVRNKKKQEENQKKEDRVIITKILDKLSEFMEMVEPGKGEKSPIQYMDELFSLSFKIQHEETNCLPMKSNISFKSTENMTHHSINHCAKILNH